jgi:hypothetical protein
MVVAIAAVVLASTGSAVAASLITSKQIKDGTIQVRDISKKARAQLKGKAGPQGVAGPQGAQGPQGAPGAQGAQGAPGADAVSFHALINGDVPASVIHGDATEVVRDNAGRYQIRFPRNLTNCTANAISAENTPRAGALVLTGPDSNFGSVTDDEIFVNLYSEDAATPADIDGDFYIQVFC